MINAKSNLTHHLKKVANSIRGKKETESPIAARCFPHEIDTIETGGGEQPTLFPPVLSISVNTLSIDNSYNGLFVDYVVVYANGEELLETTEDTVNLLDYLSDDGEYAITAKAFGDLFHDSDLSEQVEYVIGWTYPYWVEDVLHIPQAYSAVKSGKILEVL